MDAIEVFLNKRKIKSIRIDGSTKPHIRHEWVTQFQSDEETKVAILSITACSHGLTLTASSTVVFAELFWTPGIMIQAEDRVHRIGQTNSVNIYYLYAEETLDEIMLSMIMNKSTVIASTLDGINKSDYMLKGCDSGNFNMINELDKFWNGDQWPILRSDEDDKIEIHKIPQKEYEEIVKTSWNMKKRTKKENAKENAEENKDDIDNYGFGCKKQRKKRIKKNEEEKMNDSDSEWIPIVDNTLAGMLTSKNNSIISKKYSKKMSKFVNEVDKRKKKQNKKDENFIDEDSDVADEMFDMFLDEIRETNESKPSENNTIIKRKINKSNKEPKIERKGFLNVPRERENKFNVDSFTPITKRCYKKKQKSSHNNETIKYNSSEDSI